MRTSPESETIDSYIAAARPDVRPVLQAIRATIRKAVPKAEERISYKMPAFFLDGAVVYFAAFKQHIGLYPPVNDETLKPLLAKYAGPKGNLKFPLSEPIPHALIGKIVKARVREMTARKDARTAARKATAKVARAKS